MRAIAYALLNKFINYSYAIVFARQPVNMVSVLLRVCTVCRKGRENVHFIMSNEFDSS